MKWLYEMRKQDGFTLIELLVVIAVLGILTAIVVPRITGVQDNARKNALKSNASVIRNAMEMYMASEGKYPDVNDKNDMGDFADEFDGTGITINLSDADVVLEDVETNADRDTFDIELHDSNEASGFSITITEKGIESVTTR